MGEELELAHSRGIELEPHGRHPERQLRLLDRDQGLEIVSQVVAWTLRDGRSRWPSRPRTQPEDSQKAVGSLACGPNVPLSCRAALAESMAREQAVHDDELRASCCCRPEDDGERAVHGSVKVLSAMSSMPAADTLHVWVPGCDEHLDGASGLPTRAQRKRRVRLAPVAPRPTTLRGVEQVHVS